MDYWLNHRKVFPFVRGYSPDSRGGSSRYPTAILQTLTDFIILHLMFSSDPHEARIFASNDPSELYHGRKYSLVSNEPTFLSRQVSYGKNSIVFSCWWARKSIVSATVHSLADSRKSGTIFPRHYGSWYMVILYLTTTYNRRGCCWIIFFWRPSRLSWEFLPFHLTILRTIAMEYWAYLSRDTL